MIHILRLLTHLDVIKIPTEAYPEAIEWAR